MSNIKKEIDDISNDVSELSNKKNMSDIMKLNNTIATKIKNTQNKIHKLKTKTETPDANIELIDGATYEMLSTELGNSDIDKILNMNNIDKQIDLFKELERKINLCINYLNNQKMIITECDKKN